MRVTSPPRSQPTMRSTTTSTMTLALITRLSRTRSRVKALAKRTMVLASGPARPAPASTMRSMTRSAIQQAQLHLLVHLQVARLLLRVMALTTISLRLRLVVRTTLLLRAEAFLCPPAQLPPCRTSSCILPRRRRPCRHSQLRPQRKASLPRAMLRLRDRHPRNSSSRARQLRLCPPAMIRQAERSLRSKSSWTWASSGRKR